MFSMADTSGINALSDLKNIKSIQQLSGSLKEGIENGKLLIEEGSGLIRSIGQGDYLGAIVASSRLINDFIKVVTEKDPSQSSGVALEQRYLTQACGLTHASASALPVLSPWASVISIGVQIAGFALVLQRLDSIETNLHEIKEELRQVKAAILGMEQRADITTFSRLSQANGYLDNISKAATLVNSCSDEFRIQEAITAEQLFNQCAVDMEAVLMHSKLWENPEIDPNAVLFSYGRYATALFGALQAKMMRLKSERLPTDAFNYVRNKLDEVFSKPQDAIQTRYEQILSVTPLDGEQFKQFIRFGAKLPLLYNQLIVIQGKISRMLNNINFYEFLQNWALESELPIYKALSMIREADHSGYYLLLTQQSANLLDLEN